MPSYFDLFLGNTSGCVGETSALFLLLGGLYLIVKKVIRWEVPVVFISGVYVFSYVLGRDPVFAILSGGVVLGGFFMVTDMVTTPVTRKGHIIFALGCALITVIIRQWGGYPEGVCYSILIMNAFTPLIDIALTPRRLGEARKSLRDNLFAIFAAPLCFLRKRRGINSACDGAESCFTCKKSIVSKEK